MQLQYWRIESFEEVGGVCLVDLLSMAPLRVLWGASVPVPKLSHLPQFGIVLFNLCDELFIIIV